MQIQLVLIEKISPNPRNRNKHSSEQIKRLTEIIEYQGFRVPIVISNRSGKVVAGRGRLLAAKELGLKEVPVIYQDFESEEQEYAAGISDNSIASWAELDLAGINADLGELGPDFDIDLLGINNFVLDPSEINNADEKTEWVGMPEFKEGEKYINLIFQFKTELEREIFVKNNNVFVDKKMNNQWIVMK